MKPLPPLNHDLLGNLLAEGLNDMSLEVSVDHQQRLLSYLGLLHKWNRSYNLTAVRDPEHMVSRHLLDSLSLSPLLRGPRIIDVGSGAGLPGLVLAITHPHLHWVLLDSALKRTRFLIQAVHELELTNVHVERARIEDYKAEQQFDCMVARASLGLDELITVADRVLKSNALMLAMQGKFPEDASAYLKRGVEFKPLRVPGIDAQRHVAIYHLSQSD